MNPVSEPSRLMELWMIISGFIYGFIPKIIRSSGQKPRKERVFYRGCITGLNPVFLLLMQEVILINPGVSTWCDRKLKFRTLVWDSLVI